MIGKVLTTKYTKDTKKIQFELPATKVAVKANSFAQLSTSVRSNPNSVFFVSFVYFVVKSVRSIGKFYDFQDLHGRAVVDQDLGRAAVDWFVVGELQMLL